MGKQIFMVHHSIGCSFFEANNQKQVEELVNSKFEVNSIDIISKKEYSQWCKLLGIKPKIVLL
jgi:hypothetical protein